MTLKSCVIKVLMYHLSQVLFRYKPFHMPFQLCLTDMPVVTPDIGAVHKTVSRTEVSGDFLQPAPSTPVSRCVRTPG
ncbi:hypothetical protein PE019_003274 [Escherichia coli]|nr:hypothetical protein [Escherichia coli]